MADAGGFFHFFTSFGGGAFVEEVVGGFYACCGQFGGIDLANAFDVDDFVIHSCVIFRLLFYFFCLFRLQKYEFFFVLASFFLEE